MNQNEFENARTMIQEMKTEDFLNAVEGKDASDISFDHRNQLLQTACYWGDVQSSKAMLAIGADETMGFEDAFERGDTGAVETLIACGEEWDDAVFRFATRQGYIPLVEHVLSKGFDINHEDNYGLTHAIDNDQKPMCKYLIEKGASAGHDHLLLRAVANKDTYTVEKSIEQGADVHSSFETPLVKACSQDDRDTAMVLLKHGANPNANNDEPLRIACMFNAQDAIKLLLVDVKMSVSDTTKAWLKTNFYDETLKQIEKTELHERLSQKYSRPKPAQSKSKSHTMKI